MDFDPNNIPGSVVVDLTIVFIVIISGALAFFRGAVREVLAIAGWVAAAAAAYYGFDYVKPYVAPYIGVPLLTDALTSIGIFVAVMVVFVPPEEQPESILAARSLPLVEIGAVWLVEAVPSDKRADWLGAIATAKQFADTALETKDALDTLMNPPPVVTNPDKSGYSKAERKGIDHLIGTTQ